MIQVCPSGPRCNHKFRTMIFVLFNHRNFRQRRAIVRPHQYIYIIAKTQINYLTILYTTFNYLLNSLQQILIIINSASLLIVRLNTNRAKISLNNCIFESTLGRFKIKYTLQSSFTESCILSHSNKNFYNN